MGWTEEQIDRRLAAPCYKLSDRLTKVRNAERSSVRASNDRE
jgi:hypothetical protein